MAGCLLALAAGCARGPAGTAGGTTGGMANGIEGSVEMAGAPVAGVFVEAFDRAPDGMAAAVASATSDSAGRFAIPLDAGRYWIFAKKKPPGSGGGGMLQGGLPEPVAVARGVARAAPLALFDSSGESGGGSGTPVSGRVLAKGLPCAGAFVYLYPEGTRRGPGYAAKARSGADGFFRLLVPPGRYQLVARMRGDGESMGTLAAGDLVGEGRGKGGKSGGALAVGSAPLAAGTVALRTLDPRLLPARAWAGEEEGGEGLTLRGRIIDERGRPAAGMYAFLYPDYRMVGKPSALSAPTGADGTYILKVPRPGEWYLGARSRFGGPVEPGERMGVYEVDGARAPLLFPPGRKREAADMVAREIW
jgi:hypothetical protein